ncbi:phosphatidylglycerophosphatase B [Desulforhabdus sp. TSK]|nr:phosphatidylglycerophosphatase B [Desulforhabdus sp. TSK]
MNSLTNSCSWRWIWVTLGAVPVFCVLSYFYIDKPLAVHLRSANYNVLQVFSLITRLGVSTGYLVASFLFFLCFRYLNKKEAYAHQALFVFSSIAVSGLLADLLKFLFGRYRPKMLFEQGLYGFTLFHGGYAFNSFPSGHANTITAAAVALYFIYPRFRHFYAVVAILVIVSRLVLGSHYLGDVVAGSYLGILTTLYLKSIFDRKGISLQQPMLQGDGSSG